MPQTTTSGTQCVQSFFNILKFKRHASNNDWSIISCLVDHRKNKRKHVSVNKLISRQSSNFFVYMLSSSFPIGQLNKT